MPSPPTPTRCTTGGRRSFSWLQEEMQGTTLSGVARGRGDDGGAESRPPPRPLSGGNPRCGGTPARDARLRADSRNVRKEAWLSCPCLFSCLFSGLWFAGAALTRTAAMGNPVREPRSPWRRFDVRGDRTSFVHRRARIPARLPLTSLRSHGPVGGEPTRGPSPRDGTAPVLRASSCSPRRRTSGPVLRPASWRGLST